MTSNRRLLRELVGRAEAQGWRAEDRGVRVLLYSPDGRTIVTIHKTPSDRDWHHAAIRMLRRGGFDPSR